MLESRKWLAQYTSSLVGILPWSVGTYFVLFGLEITELQMNIKSYIVCRVNVVTLCVHFLFF